jgi:hypothetical protein
LERKLTILRWSDAETQQFNIARIRRSESRKMYWYIKCYILILRKCCSKKNEIRMFDSEIYLTVRVFSNSVWSTQLWNSTSSSRIHSSVMTGIMSWRPTTSFPCLGRSFTPNSTSGNP